MILEIRARDFILLHNLGEQHGRLSLGKLSEFWYEEPLRPPSPSRPPVCVFRLGRWAADSVLEGNQGKWLLKAHRLTGGRKMTFAGS